MKVLVVNEPGVRALLPMASCVPLMREALATFARGDAVLPLRTLLRLPDGSGLLGVMPGYLGAPQSFGLKAVSVMPGNHGTPYDSHQGVVLLFGVTLKVLPISGSDTWLHFVMPAIALGYYATPAIMRVTCW